MAGAALHSGSICASLPAVPGLNLGGGTKFRLPLQDDISQGEEVVRSNPGALFVNLTILINFFEFVNILQF